MAEMARFRREMYDGNGPLSNMVRGFTLPTTEGRPVAPSVPVTYNNTGNGMPWMTDALAAGGAALKDVAGFFTDKSAATRPTYGVDGKLVPSPTAAAPATVLTPAAASVPATNQALERPTTNMTATEMTNSAIAKTPGFGYQGGRQVATTTPEQDDAQRLAARDAQYAATAADAKDTAEREAFGAARIKEAAAASEAVATKDRITSLQNVIRANIGNQYDGPAKIAAAQAEIATLVGQQGLANKLEEERLKGGFDIEKARMVKEGVVDAAKEKAKGDATDNAYKMGMLRVAQDNSANTIKNSLSKEDQIALNAAARQEAAAAKEEADMVAAAAKTDDPALALTNMREMKKDPRGFAVRSNLRKFIDVQDKVGKLQYKRSDEEVATTLKNAGYSSAEIAQALNMRKK